MKHKKLLIVALVVVAVAIAASAAYAWWTSSDSLSDNNIATGTLGIEVQGRTGPIDVTGLAPSYQPAFKSLGTIFALNEQDADAEADFPSAFFWVHNTGDQPEMFYAWADITGQTADIRSKVMCRIWLNPVDYPDPVDPEWWKSGDTYCVWQGPLSDIDTPAQGRARIRTLTPDGDPDPLPPSTYAVYKVVFWLDSSALNGTQGQSLTIDLNIEGGQVDAWGTF
jgi:predicted ribosomally synthesized peptide with SipW-like signal peptide